MLRWVKEKNIGIKHTYIWKKKWYSKKYETFFEKIHIEAFTPDKFKKKIKIWALSVTDSGTWDSMYTLAIQTADKREKEKNPRN